jgi:methionyl-tRNA synthetase
METFYVTTPIYYVNAKPHIGTAYTTIVADIIARWKRLEGKEVFFLTGTDEHGTKIERAAAAAGKTPQTFVDEISSEFMNTWKPLNISYDKFIRTTDERHIITVNEFLDKLWDNGDIYKGTYEGWYCVPDETFITDTDLKDGNCPSCGREVQRVKEEAYFFALSRYKEDLLQLYSDNPYFIYPESKLKEIRGRLKDNLKDLDITRKGVKWGIPFKFDPEHTIYVWFDALLNYISALGWPNDESFNKFWPVDVHVVGKDIIWFHAVVWPAMLMSAGIDMPKLILAHGWWTVNGTKMSKSLGNVIDPIEMAKKYGADALRYFLIKEKPVWEDGDFSENALVSRINGELMSDLSNLVARTLTLAEKFDGKLKYNEGFSDNLDMTQIVSKFDSYNLSGALEDIWSFVRRTNKYINDNEPWKLNGEKLLIVLNDALEALRIISILIYSFMPETAENLSQQLGLKLGKIDDCKFGEFNGKVKRGKNLFEKVKN